MTVIIFPIQLDGLYNTVFTVYYSLFIMICEARTYNHKMYNTKRQRFEYPTKNIYNQM